MSNIIYLDLTEHCIETAARHAHRQVTDLLMKSDSADTILEAKLVILNDLLQAENFAQLRTDHPELAGGSPIRVALQRAPSRRVSWRVVS
jgi:hypothetical protein